MPHRSFIEMPTAEHAEMRAARRRARDGSRLALHLVWWGAAGRTPTDSAAVRFGSRSRVYRPVRAYRQGRRGWQPAEQGRLLPPGRTTVLLPRRRRSLVARLQAPPRAYGGCRTRWRGATLALTWPTTRGLTVAAETMRRGVHEGDWGWKRSTLVAKDDDPRRVERWARSRLTCAPLTRDEAMVVAEALDIPVLPKGGCAWRPPGTPLAVMTPGQHPQHSRAGALDLAPGTLPHGLGPRNTNARCRDLRARREACDPTDR